ncbi:MAG: hypothetical protein WDA74_08395 [Spirochaetota bacterium]
MEPYFKNIEKSKLNKIIECSIKNNQVWNAGECAMNYIPKLLQERKSDIDPKKYNELKRKIGNRMQ